MAKLKPPAKGQIDYYDAGMPGLVLRLNYGGRKTWRALHYLKRLDKDGNRVSIPTTHTLGTYPHLKLKEAREKARAFLADPQRALAQADTGSFGEVAASFIRRHVEANQLRSEYEVKRLLKKYILPAWQNRAFRDLKRSDVIALLDGIADDHGARQADMVLAIVRKLMNWYATRNDDYTSPVVRGMARYNPADRKRSRILDDDEIRALWRAGDEAGRFGAILKVALLTTQRRDKVVTMKWDDLADGEWIIHSAIREKPNAGRLRLPPVVVDIISAQRRIVGNPYVFPAASGSGPFNSFSKRKAAFDAELAFEEPWVVHDLRRTARSLMARAGVRPDIAERVLGHVIPGVEGVYDRHTYADEKADALAKLAALVERIVHPPDGNVVDIRAGRSGEAGLEAGSNQR